MEKFEFKPMQWVLARDNEDEKWTLCQFSHIGMYEQNVMCGGAEYNYCIPYKGNKHLLGTTDPYVGKCIPKDGDYVYAEGFHNHIFIFREKINNMICAYAELFNERDVNINEDVALIENIKIIRPATEEEKQLLLSKLHEIGKDWDAEKKEVVDWKWMPNDGEDYYYCDYILDSFKVRCATYTDTGYMPNPLDISTPYKTEEECKAMCDKLNEAIKNVK